MRKGVNFRTFFFFNLYCSHISSSFHHLKWKKYTCNKTRNQWQKGTKSIHSWELWLKIYLGKNKHTLLVALGKRYFFSTVMGNFNELKNHWRAYWKRELESHFSFFGSMICYVVFHKIFSEWAPDKARIQHIQEEATGTINIDRSGRV